MNLRQHRLQESASCSDIPNEDATNVVGGGFNEECSLGQVPGKTSFSEMQCLGAGIAEATLHNNIVQHKLNTYSQLNVQQLKRESLKISSSVALQRRLYAAVHDMMIKKNGMAEKDFSQTVCESTGEEIKGEEIPGSECGEQESGLKEQQEEKEGEESCSKKKSDVY